MLRKSTNRMALAFTLAGLLLLAGCHKKNGHDIAQDDQIQFMDQDMGSQRLAEYDRQSVDYQSQVSSGPSMADPMPQVVSQVPSTPNYTSHTIRRGETLWSIAKQYYNNGQQWKKIVAANPGLDPAKLKIGQQIVIP